MGILNCAGDHLEQSNGQNFSVGKDFFAGGKYIQDIKFYASKGVHGNFSVEIFLGSKIIYTASNINLTDTNPTSNFGVVGGGNISIIRNSKWNLSGFTEKKEKCMEKSGCIYYPLFSTYISPGKNFKLYIPNDQVKMKIRFFAINLKKKWNGSEKFNG